MLRWLVSLRAFAILNIAFFIYLFYDGKFWKYYIFINTTIIIAYVVYNYGRIIVNKLNPKSYSEMENKGYTVVIPCFNEESELLKECVRSVMEQKNIFKKEIIIVDDGSTNNIWKTIQELGKKYPEILTLRSKENKGKRNAHLIAINKSRQEFIVSIDSDTILKDDAIKNLLKPFSNNNIGATTGNVLIKNESKNWLTRIQAGLYWVGLNIYKDSQSTMGNVLCCSGCLSAYRKSDILDIMDEYLNQSFQGNKCNASEDRYLTNLINEKGKDVVYVKDAVCLTEAPTTMKKFIKQQWRWKKGYMRETLYTTTYAWKKSKALFLENVIFMMFLPILQFAMTALTIYILFANPMYFFVVLFPLLLLFIIARDILFFAQHPIKGLLYLPYIFLYMFVLYPMNVATVFHSNPERWGTR